MRASFPFSFPTPRPRHGRRLALAIAPLAYLAARSPVFRVAPFTALIVLLLAGQFKEGPITAAAIRLFEVAFGGVVAVGVSLLILPERAHSVGRRQAVEALHRLAQTLPRLLSGLGGDADPDANSALQDQAGAAVTALAQSLAEEEHERLFRVGSLEDLRPLSRTLVRLRHDLVIVGRAAAAPLPAGVGQRLMPLIDEVGVCVSRYMNVCADALAKRQTAPPSAQTDAALDASRARSPPCAAKA